MLPGLLAVGGDEAGEILAGVAVEGGIEDDNGDLLIDHGLDWSDQGGVVERGEDDPVDALGLELLNDLDLLGAVVLLVRALPNDRDTQVFAGLLGALLHALPEDMRGALGNDGDGEGRVRGFVGGGLVAFGLGKTGGTGE